MGSIGCVEGCLRDEARPDWDGRDARPVRWTAWYPASGDGSPAGEAPARVTGGPGDAETSSVPAPLFETETLVRGVTPLDTLAGRPLVLLSHGTGGSATGLAWLGRRLAESGFVCIGVDHHGNTAVEPYRAEGFLCWWERVTDLSTVLDRLDDLAPLVGRVDRDRVHAVGFSLGGYTVLALLGAISSLERFEGWRRDLPGGMEGPREFPDLGAEVARLTRDSRVFRESLARHGESFADARVRSAVALAPAPPVRAFTDVSLGAIERGVLILAGEADAEAPFGPCAAWLASRNHAFELRSLGPEVGHYVMLPECTAAGRRLEPGLCVDAPDVDRRGLHERVAGEVAAFLGRD